MINSMGKKKERQSNIELLRIISLIGVIVLHFNHPANGAMLYAAPGSANYYLTYFFESAFICAVDVFVLITGYFMCTSFKRDIVKPIKFMFLIFLFKFVDLAIRYLFLPETITRFSLLSCFLPNNYFIVLYVTLYLISAYFNIVIDRLDEKGFRRLLVILLLLFSFWNVGADLANELYHETINGLSTIGTFGSEYGLTIVNFSLLYLLGAYIRKYGREYSSGKLLACYLLCTLILTVWAVFDTKLGALYAFDSLAAWEYCNPLVILQACAAFCLFKKLQIKNKTLSYIYIYIYRGHASQRTFFTPA